MSGTGNYNFDPRFMSHKFMRNQLKHDIGFCIQSGNLVWIDGLFLGSENNITNCCQATMGALERRKMNEADGGYNGKQFYIKIPTDAKCSNDRYMKINARLFDKAANHCFNIRKILNSHFCQPFEIFSMLQSCCCLTQLSTLHAVEYFNKLKTKLREIFFELNCN